MNINPNYQMTPDQVHRTKEFLAAYKRIREGAPEIIAEAKRQADIIYPGASKQLEKLQQTLGAQGKKTSAQLTKQFAAGWERTMKAGSIDELIPDAGKGIINIPEAEKARANHALKQMQKLGKVGTAAYKYFKLPEWKRSLYGGAAFGGGLAVAGAMFDGEDDNLGTITKKFVVGTALEIASERVMEWGIHKFAVHKGDGYISKISGGAINLKEVESSLGINLRPRPLMAGAAKWGAIAGAVGGMFIGNGEGIFGNIKDAVVYGGAGFGLGTLLNQMNEGKKPRMQEGTAGKVAGEIDRTTAEVVRDGNKVKVGVGDMTKDQVKLKVKDPKAATTRAVRQFKGPVRAIGLAAVGLFGAGVAADISNEMAEKRRVERERMNQERKLADKEREQDKAMRKMFGYDYFDYGNIVQELWDNRTGHHKMGNAKFN